MVCCWLRIHNCPNVHQCPSIMNRHQYRNHSLSGQIFWHSIVCTIRHPNERWRSLNPNVCCKVHTWSRFYAISIHQPTFLQHDKLDGHISSKWKTFFVTSKIVQQQNHNNNNNNNFKYSLNKFKRIWFKFSYFFPEDPEVFIPDQPPIYKFHQLLRIIWFFIFECNKLAMNRQQKSQLPLENIEHWI